MQELIERLEKAERPARELDFAIGQSLGCGYLGQNYTSSIDAALKLVPDGFSIHISILPRNCVGVRVGHQKEETGTYGVPPAITIVIAALKARMQKER